MYAAVQQCTLWWKAFQYPKHFIPFVTLDDATVQTPSNSTCNMPLSEPLISSDKVQQAE